MTDSPGGFADTPGPEATPEQDADVRALLGALREAEVRMPDDVWARVHAVIAEEQRVAARTGLPAATLAATEGSSTDEDGSVVPGLAPVTVLPTAEERAARAARPALRWMLGAAAAVVVLGGGYAVLQGVSGSSQVATSAGAASVPAPERAPEGPTVMLRTGTAYTTAGLQSQARALVASAAAGQPVSTDDKATPQPVATDDPQASPVPPSTSGTTYVGATAEEARSAAVAKAVALVPKNAAFTACIDDLSGTPGTKPVAVDVGTYDGKPALVVVLPSTDDPASLDVIVVPADCRSSEFIQLVRVPRP
jgi:hypothetical protein